MVKKTGSEAKSASGEIPSKVGSSRKVSKKKVIKSTKRNTSTKVGASKGSKKATAKKGNTRKPATKVPKVDIPKTIEGTPILEILASSPKVAGTLATPFLHKLHRHWEVTLEIDDTIRNRVIPLMDYKPGQYMVAILIPIENTTDAVPWFDLNEGMDLMHAPKESDWKEREVSTAFIMELLGFTSKRRVQQLSAEGHLKKNSRGRYQLHESLRLYMQHLKDQATGKGGTQLVDRKLKSLDLDNFNKTLDIRKKAEELVEAAEAERAGFEFGNRIKTMIQRWPAQYAAMLTASKKKTTTMKILNEAIEKLLLNLSAEGEG